MEIYLINLDRCTDRLRFQTRQFAQLGLKFTRVAAVSTDDISRGELKRRRSQGVRPMSDAEIACLLSHGRCWEQIVASNRTALVLEDDAVLSAHLPDLLPMLEQHCSYKRVSLEAFGDKTKLLRNQTARPLGQSHVELHEMIKDSAGAAGYIVCPNVARNLLDGLTKDSLIADTFLGIYGKLPQMQAVPALVVQMAHVPDHGMAVTGLSNIPETRRLNVTLSHRLRRLRIELRVLRQKLTCVLSGRQQSIPICATILSSAKEEVFEPWSN